MASNCNTMRLNRSLLKNSLNSTDIKEIISCPEKIVQLVSVNVFLYLKQSWHLVSSGWESSNPKLEKEKGGEGGREGENCQNYLVSFCVCVCMCVYANVCACTYVLT